MVDRRLDHLTGKPDVQEVHRICLIAASIIEREMRRAEREIPAVELDLIKKLSFTNYTLVRAQSSAAIESNG